jgi:hypothetical protein
MYGWGASEMFTDYDSLTFNQQRIDKMKECDVAKLFCFKME